MNKKIGVEVMLKNITSKQRNIIVAVTAVWGFILIGSGVTMSLMDEPTTTTKTELKVTQKRVANMKSNEIRLKNMEQEINQPISVNIRDYLENVDDIEDSIIKELQLDTSMVNVNQAGEYVYTITYGKKTFNGTFTINEKPLPDMVLTLKNLDLEIGSALSTDVQTYITETLTEEVKQNVKLNLTSVNTAQAGSYQYTVTYNGRLYTGTITIFEPQKTETPSTPTEDTDETKNNTNESNQTQTTT